MAQGEQTGPVARYGLLLLTLVASYLLSAVTHSKWAEAVHVGLRRRYRAARLATLRAAAAKYQLAIGARW